MITFLFLICNTTTTRAKRGSPVSAPLFFLKLEAFKCLHTAARWSAPQCQTCKTFQPLGAKAPQKKKRQASPLRVFPDSACPFMWFTKSKRAARRFCFVIFLVSIFLRFTQKIITHFHTNARPILILVSKLSLGFWGNMAVFSHFWGFFIDF